MTHRILVTGSRNWNDDRVIHDTIKYFLQPDSVVVHGHCPTGADAIADRLCRDWGWRYERHPAKWAQPCGPDCKHRRPRSPHLYPCAGPVRNQLMVDLGADVCLAFITPESRGTWDCVRRAEAAGIHVVKVFAGGD
jgi:hypothetical protein